MGPALQRLLSRASSLDLLRYLVRTLEKQPCPNPPWKFRGTAGEKMLRYRRYSGLASAAKGVEDLQLDKYHETPIQTNARGPTWKLSKQLLLLGNPPKRIKLRSPSRDTHKPYIVSGEQYWHEHLWTREEIEFQSNLDAPVVAVEPRLLDTEEHKQDMELWHVLLQYRKRVHGHHGVLTFLDALTERGVMIPTNGPLADGFWLAFLDIGVQDLSVMKRIFQYAEFIWKREERFWSKLYTHTVRFFLTNSRSKDALEWHNLLFKNYAPGPRSFAEMCRHVVFWGGDLEALRSIYSMNTYRNVYSKVVPLLCQREDFRAALNWHHFFVRKGDLPSSSKIVEPLLRYLVVYDTNSAARVRQALVDARLSWESNLSSELEDNTKISREMMNLIHGKTFNVSVKKYNDSLGARWFASKWISLDIAISGIHALGIDEIGPLSLQAIALRNPDPQSVMLRIIQLQNMGISIGTSLYSRAIEEFAKRRNNQHLEGLLKSDQHPDALEDKKLQYELLSSFARARDWAQYRRTLSILSLSSKSPYIEKRNIELRCLIDIGDHRGIRAILRRMEDENCPVKPISILQFIRYILLPRRYGRRPMTIKGRTNRGKHNDLNKCIGVLKKIMETGSYIPVVYWREVIRRLGMLGRLNNLRDLVMFLATWYAPQRRFPLSRSRYYHLPSQLPSSHPLHPTKIIFNEQFQRNVIEWGFIASLRRKPWKPHGYDPRRIHYIDLTNTPNVTFGIKLLKSLNQRGVHINGPSVRKAIFHRLAIYYGPGISNRFYNRKARRRMKAKLSVVAKQIDEALGEAFFTTVDLLPLINTIAMKAWTKARRKRQRKVVAYNLRAIKLPQRWRKRTRDTRLL